MVSVVAMPKDIDPTERLIEGFAPASLAIGPDGTVAPIAVKPESRLATIPICQLGPCSHYHEIVTRMDAQEPEDGTPGEVFVKRTRTCYPASGIEMDITANPPCKCSLWMPRTDFAATTERIRAEYKTNHAAEFEEFRRSWPDKVRLNVNEGE